MSWIPWFYAAVAAITFSIGAVSAARAPRSEKVFAVGTLLMPVGFALWAYGYAPDGAHDNVAVIETGSACLLVGVILFILLTIRHSRAPK